MTALISDICEFTQYHSTFNSFCEDIGHKPVWKKNWKLLI